MYFVQVRRILKSILIHDYYRAKHVHRSRVLSERDLIDERVNNEHHPYVIIGYGQSNLRTVTVH